MHVLKWLFDELADEDGILLDDAYYAFKQCAGSRSWCGGHYLCAAAAKRGGSGDVEMASRGRILQDMFRRRRLVRCPGRGWSRWTCTAAASGHLDVLRWAFENGCPANKNVVRRAKS